MLIQLGIGFKVTDLAVFTSIAHLLPHYSHSHNPINHPNVVPLPPLISQLLH